MSDDAALPLGAEVCRQRGFRTCEAPLLHPGRTMSTDNTMHGARRKLKMHSRLSVLTIVIGVVLMIFMISTESEPGALPLLLILLGSGWHLITRGRTRSHHQ